MYSVFYNFTWNSYCICIFSYFLPPFTGGSRDSRHYHSCVHNLRVSTVYSLMLLYLLLYLQHYFRIFAPVFFLVNFRYHPMCVQCTEKESSERAFISTPWYQYFLSTAFLYLKDFITTFCCYLHPFCTYNPLSNCVSLIKQKMNE